MGQGQKNAEYEVKLCFAIFLSYFFSLSSFLLLEKENHEGKQERENTNTKIRLGVNLVTEVVWPGWEMPQPLQGVTAPGTGLSTGNGA